MVIIFLLRLPIPGIITAAIGAGAFFLKVNTYVEYEYIFTNGEIDVDAIYDMRIRKRLITFNVKDIELLVEANSDAAKDFDNKPEKELIAFPASSTQKPYVAMITGGVERVQFMFTPSEEFIRICTKYNPRAVRYNQRKG